MHRNQFSKRQNRGGGEIYQGQRWEKKNWSWQINWWERYYWHFIDLHISMLTCSCPTRMGNDHSFHGGAVHGVRKVPPMASLVKDYLKDLTLPWPSSSFPSSGLQPPIWSGYLKGHQMLWVSDWPSWSSGESFLHVPPPMEARRRLSWRLYPSSGISPFLYKPTR